MSILIRDGKIVDPANGLYGEDLDILISDDRIAKVGQHIPSPKGCNIEVIDASGLLVTPGLIDIHTHLREPGQEHKETIYTGMLAAASGGFTSIIAMANTEPVADSPDIIQYVLDRARLNRVINVFPAGCVTKGLSGKEIVNIKELVSSGVVALSDDGKPVYNPDIMRQALLECKNYGIPIISHCEEAKESHTGWVMNEGAISSRMNLKGIPNSAEEIMVERDINLAEETGSHLHIAHVSTAGSVELVRNAKKRGIKVTAEATPHHFTLTDSAVEKYGANAKMNPPLRCQNDVNAVIDGLSDGTIDVIATDHAPHTQDEKSQGMEKAPFGIIGLETCLPLVITYLVNENLSIYDAIAKMTLNPSRILNLNRGTLSEGAEADITIIDVDKENVIDASKFKSKGRNTPFDGWRLKGQAVMTIVGGKINHDLLEVA